MAGAATVEKAIDVLFHLHDAKAALGVSEIGRALDLPKSSCHRLLSSLLGRELVDRDERGRYRPGLALLSLGLGAQQREPVVSAARPVLEREVAEVGETVFLVSLRHGHLRVLDKVEGSGFLRAAPGVGDIVPAEVTAAGRLYAALDSSTPEPREGGFPRLAEGEAEEIAQRGYATNRDAWIEGLSVLGVPIWQDCGPGQRALAAVMAVAAASPRFQRLGEEALAGRLLLAAEQVGERLSASRTLRNPERSTDR